MAEQAEQIDFDKGGKWGAIEVALTHPFTLHGVFYDRVRLREPSGYDMEKYLTDPERTGVVFMRSLADFPAEVWAKMHGSDYRAIWAKASGFLF